MGVTGGGVDFVGDGWEVVVVGSVGWVVVVTGGLGAVVEGAVVVGRTTGVGDGVTTGRAAVGVGRAVAVAGRAVDGVARVGVGVRGVAVVALAGIVASVVSTGSGRASSGGAAGMMPGATWAVPQPSVSERVAKAPTTFEPAATRPAAVSRPNAPRDAQTRARRP